MTCPDSHDAADNCLKSMRSTIGTRIKLQRFGLLRSRAVAYHRAWTRWPKTPDPHNLALGGDLNDGLGVIRRAMERAMFLMFRCPPGQCSINNSDALGVSDGPGLSSSIRKQRARTAYSNAGVAFRSGIAPQPTRLPIRKDGASCRSSGLRHDGRGDRKTASLSGRAPAASRLSNEADVQLFTVYSFELTAGGKQVKWTKAEERARSGSPPQSRSQLEVPLRHLRHL